MEKTLFRSDYRILLCLLRSARQAAGVTQEEVAARLGVPRSTVTKWETGQQRIDVLEFWSLCEVMEVDPIALLVAYKDMRSF